MLNRANYGLGQRTSPFDRAVLAATVTDQNDLMAMLGRMRDINADSRTEFVFEGELNRLPTQESQRNWADVLIECFSYEGIGVNLQGVSVVDDVVRAEFNIEHVTQAHSRGKKLEAFRDAANKIIECSQQHFQKSDSRGRL